MRITYRTIPLLFFMLGTLVFSGCKTVSMFDMKSEGEMFTSLTKITETPNAVSPFGGDNDGPLFFAYQADGKGQCNIYKKDNPLSNSMTQMTGVDVAIVPTYSKVADKIAFRMNNDIYTMSASKGKALTQITSTNDCKEDHPCFSPDGKYIVYDRIMWGSYNGVYNYFTDRSEIWIKNLETGENMLIGKGYTPSFSPDGKKIVYCKVENIEASIWVMDFDGDNQSKITDNNTLESAQRPRFSPDGNQIIFDASDKSGNMDLYVISVDGDNLTRLTVNKSSDTQPYWSTDGYIYFVSDRGGKAKNFNIWRLKY